VRAGRRTVIAQVDVFCSSDDELAATATVNFAVVSRDERR
jgi:acyl-coenzyme A thioesterase PaaI-like protein